MYTTLSIAKLSALFALGFFLFYSNTAAAHCDGLDGPVVQAAQAALASGDVNLVLAWGRKVDEHEIRRAFDRTMAVRNLSAEARKLADMYFFETLVRIHRIGEGASYTGLKLAGRDLGPAIPLTDQMLASGKIDPLLKLLTETTRNGLIERFDRAVKARNYLTTDLEAGRAYVQSYVTLIHYVERAYEAGIQPVAGHFPEEDHQEGEHDK